MPIEIINSLLMLQYCIKQIQTNTNTYILYVLSIKLRYTLHFSFSIPIPGFPHVYYMLGENMGLLLYGGVSVMLCIAARCEADSRYNRGRASSSHEEIEKILILIYF